MTLVIAAGSNRMIIVSTGDEGTIQTVSSIDNNGNAGVGTKVGSATVGSAATQQNVEMWRIMEADLSTGTNVIQVNFAGSVVGGGISAMSVSDVAQQAQENVTTTTCLTCTLIFDLITTLTDKSMIFSVVGNGQSGTYTSHGTGQTERFDFEPTSAVFTGTTEILTSAGEDNQSHTTSISANRQAMVSAAFAPSSGSAQEFSFVNGAWNVNVTVPVFSDGLKDLFLNATHTSVTVSDTETNACNYGSTDSCTYTSGDFDVLCIDNCTITDNINLGGNNLTITAGPGNFDVRADIINFDKIVSHGPNLCEMRIYSGGFG